MSLFGFYRVLDFKGKINISTITDPGVEFDMDMFSMYISIFRDLVISKELKYKWKPLLILKSAPGVRNKEFANSTAAAARQASAILGNLAVYKPLWALYKLYGASWVIPKLEAAAKM